MHCNRFVFCIWLSAVGWITRWPAKPHKSGRTTKAGTRKVTPPTHTRMHARTHTHTHTRLTALCPGLPGWASTRKVKPVWISLLFLSPNQQCQSTHTHTYPFNGPFSGTTQVSWYQKGKTNLDFTEARDSVSGSGISWAICKSAPRSRQITTPAPHHSVFYRPDAFPAAQPTVSKHLRQITNHVQMEANSAERMKKKSVENIKFAMT